MCLNRRESSHKCYTQNKDDDSSIFSSKGSLKSWT